ncbi:hypothetical protein M501DRAFT_1013018 [Patellaria atrata CBS 101060]|uniref:Uncharacterized protein n=1 Tax=Patellaria atrata CBS 101060 TaxID=1346257 RepID=A0A9P4SL93_9PEZI|nr:hypothetical protein M501DRAFT_1013018 [Patellaria atrata CBS 101060]
MPPCRHKTYKIDYYTPKSTITLHRPCLERTCKTCHNNQPLLPTPPVSRKSSAAEDAGYLADDSEAPTPFFRLKTNLPYPETPGIEPLKPFLPNPVQENKKIYWTLRGDKISVREVYTPRSPSPSPSPSSSEFLSPSPPATPLIRKGIKLHIHNSRVRVRRVLKIRFRQLRAVYGMRTGLRALQLGEGEFRFPTKVEGGIRRQRSGPRFRWRVCLRFRTVRGRRAFGGLVRELGRGEDSMHLMWY